MSSLASLRDRGEVDKIRSEINRLFYEYFGRLPSRRLPDRGDWSPAVDISETDQTFVVHVEAPGMERKDLELSLRGRILLIKGKKRKEREEKNKSHYRIERKYGAFSRSLELPDEVDVDKLEARYKDGVLTISIPKMKDLDVRKIEVKPL